MPEPWNRAARPQRTAWVTFLLALLVFALGCATPVGLARAGSLLGSPHSTSSAPPKPHLFPTTVSEETVRARLGSGSGPDRP